MPKGDILTFDIGYFKIEAILKIAYSLQESATIFSNISKYIFRWRLYS